MTELTDDKARAKVWKLIKDIRVAQLITHDGDTMHARPMAAMNTEFDGVLWYFTKADSPKIQEIGANANVLVSYSEPSKQEYVSLQGKAHVLNDREQIAKLWAEPARIWFPQGKTDPSLRLIRVDVARAEYWDSPSQALVMIYGYAVARLTAEVPDIGENRKVAY